MARPVVTDSSTPFTISLFFDNRDYLSKGDDIGSIKLSVWGRRQSKRKRYSTKLFCTAEVFEAVSGQHTKARTGKGRGAARKVIDRPPLSAQQKNKLKLDNRILLNKIQALLRKAESINDQSICRTLQDFENEISSTSSTNFFDAAEDVIKNHNDKQQWKSASRKRTTLNHVKKFCDNENLDINDVNITFLQDFESHLNREKCSINTIAGYMTDIQSIYNHAINKRLISDKYYPFGKGDNYTIVREETEKEVLSSSDWAKLMKFETPYPARTKALEMFKLSYALNGANTIDILTMLKTDLTEDQIKFFRKKTKETKKIKAKRVVTKTEFIELMIIKYGAEIDSTYLFDILDHRIFKLNTKETRNKVEEINGRWNKQLKIITNKLEIPSISMMWARHQRATDYGDLGVSEEDINNMWGHDSIKTTKRYLHSLPKKKIVSAGAELDKKLM